MSYTTLYGQTRLSGILRLKYYSKVFWEQQEGVKVLGRTGERYTNYIPTFIFPINALSEIRVDFSTGRSPRSDRGRVEFRVQPRKNNLEKVSRAKILSNNCLKAVLENMKLGFRLFLVQKLPDIKSIEKETFLKIEYLSVTPRSICIEGDATYNLKVQRFDKSKNRFCRPKPFNSCLWHDVDKYGIKIPWGPLSPGDLDFGRSNEEEETENVSKLEDIKKEIVRNRLFAPETMIKEQEWKANRFQLRKEQIEPNYKFFLEFSIYGYSFRKAERMEYSENRNFDQAVRYMMMKVFGERKAPIFVKKLALESNLGTGRDILRFPESLKMNVQHLTVRGNKNGLAMLEPVFTGMESIGVDQILESDIEFLRKIHKVVIFDLMNNRVVKSTLHQNLESLPKGKNLIFTSSSTDLIFGVLRNWRKIKPESGTQYIFGGDDHEMEYILENISKEEGADVKEMTKKRGPFIHPIVTVPINELLEIKVSMFKASKRFDYNMYELAEHHVLMEQKILWWLKMEVQPKSFLM